MVKKRVIAVLDDLESTNKNLEKAKELDERHEKTELTSTIRDDESRNIYKNIKVSRAIEKKILAIKDARKDNGVKGVTFDSLVYEAILEFIDNHFASEVEGN